MCLQTERPEHPVDTWRHREVATGWCQNKDVVYEANNRIAEAWQPQHPAH